MRRGPQFERVDHAAKPLVHLGGRVPGNLERLVHHLRTMIPDRSTGKLNPVADNIILIGKNFQRVLLTQRLHPALRHGERIMRESDGPGLLIKFKHREIHDPAEPVHILGYQIKIPPQFRPQIPADLVHRVHHVADKEHHIAIHHSPSGGQGLDLILGQKLHDRPLDHPTLPDKISQSLAPQRLGILHQFIKETARPIGNPLHRDGPHHAPLLNHSLEGIELGRAENVRHILHLDRNTEIRLIRPVFYHRGRIGNPDKGSRINRPCRKLREHTMNDVFHHGKHVILRHKRHLHVQLVELTRRPVSPRVLIAEARRNLEIAVKS